MATTRTTSWTRQTIRDFLIDFDRDWMGTDRCKDPGTPGAFDVVCWACEESCCAASHGHLDAFLSEHARCGPRPC